MNFIKKYLLIDLLNSFSDSEMERFNNFVGSAYFNTDQWAIKLLGKLQQNVLGQKLFDDTIQTKIYRAVFFNKKSKQALLDKEEKRLLYVKMSVLTALAKKFLTIEALEENPHCENELLSKKLLKKNQFRLITRHINKKQKYLIEQKAKGIDYYALAFQLETSTLNHLHLEGTLLKEDNFPNLVYDLDMYYILNKLKLHLTMVSVANVTKKSYDLAPVKSIYALLELPQYQQHPLIQIYKTIIKLMETYEEDTYFSLLKLLNQYFIDIPKGDLIDFYAITSNFCIHQFRTGKIKYKRELFELYKTMDKKNLLLEEELMQVMQLKNIIATACGIGEFEWATETIHKYSPFIKKNLQKSVYHFNLGIIDFYKTFYKEAISHLIRVDKINLAYDLDCRILTLQSYYQMDTYYSERTMQIFRSTEKFITTNKQMPLIHKKSYKNFIRILINLYRVRHQIGKTTIESIKIKLSKINVIMAKKWLMDKITEIE